MRRILLNLAFSVALASGFSCKDLLMEEPKALTVEGFYNTSSEVEAGLAAMYPPIRSNMSGWWLGILESHTEWGAGMNGAANFDSYKSMQGLTNVGANNLIRNWDGFYQSIRNANLVINYTPSSKVLTAAQIDRYVGEAKFLRAFCYFQLVRGWGGVPIHTEANLDESSSIPKSSQQQVYELITSDLKFAESSLPDDAPLLGKPSKWAAKSVLADVLLYQEMYPEAAAKAMEVIQSGKYSLERITVADDFNKLFGMGAQSTEEIFYLKYNPNFQSQIVLFTQQITTPWFGKGGYGVITWHDQAKLYTTWNDGDLRKHFNWYEEKVRVNAYLPGQTAFPSTGVTLLSPKKFNAPASTIATFSLPCYRYAEVLLIHAEASARAAGPTAPGLESLNKVHRRAFGLDPSLVSDIDFTMDNHTIKSFTDLVIREKGYEFQFEGKRWYDLKRSGTLNEVMKMNIDREVADKHLLWPIPQIEFDLNPGLNQATDQNPGY